MHRKSKRAIGYILPALAQPVPDVTRYYGLICMIELVRPPPNPMLDIRHRLLGIIEDAYSGRNVFFSQLTWLPVLSSDRRNTGDIFRSVEISSYFLP